LVNSHHLAVDDPLRRHLDHSRLQGGAGQHAGEGRMVGWEEWRIAGSTWQACITLDKVQHTTSPACHTAEQKLANTPQGCAAAQGNSGEPHLEAVEPVGSEAGLPPDLAQRRGGPGGGGGRVQAGAPAGRG
jgi:hypothetical protein